MEYSFVARNLSRCIKYADLVNNQNLKHKNQRLSISQKSSLLVDSDQLFNDSMKVTRIANKPCYVMRDIENSLVLRLLSKNISLAYSLNPSNRDSITSLFIAFLKECSPYHVHRFDIESFYESIDRDDLLKKIKTDGKLSKKNLSILELWFNELLKLDVKGLPRGIGLSSTLSELTLQSFDKSMKISSNTFYFARFVDDIVVITNYGAKHDEVSDLLKAYLPYQSLKIHKTGQKVFNQKVSKAKSKSFTTNELNTEYFNYLGYKYLVLNELSDNDVVLGEKRRHVKIDISDDKLKKLKHRLLVAFLSYSSKSNPSSDDYELLIKRLRFLTGNYTIDDTSPNPAIRSGIFYNYRYINQTFQLTKLDRYLTAILFCSKYKVFRKIQRSISKHKRREIAKFSFLNGHQKKLFYKFSYKDFIEIKRIWQ